MIDPALPQSLRDEGVLQARRGNRVDPPALQTAPLFLPREEAQERLRKALRESLSTQFRSPLLDQTRYLSETPGKLLRSQLTLLAAANDEDLVPRDAIRAGLVLELIHLASLIHDDILDEAPLRRGRKTLHLLTHTHRAILVGDSLLAYALRLMSGGDREGGHPQILHQYSRCFQDLCWGESVEYEQTRDQPISVRTYLRVASAKTASLFSASLLAGVSLKLGEVSESKAQKILRQHQLLGTRLGLLFQIQDDLGDFFAPTPSWGKEMGTDWRNGVWSLPLVFAEEFLRKDQADTQTSSVRLKAWSDPMDLRQLLIESGALLKAVRISEHFAQAAQAQLSRMSLHIDQQKRWEERILYANRISLEEAQRILSI